MVSNIILHPKYSILKWDSNFFGFTVAKIITDKLNFKDLKKILTDLKKRNVSLAYFASDSANKDLQKAAKSLGGFLTGQKITYILDLKSIPAKSSVSAVPVEEYDKVKPNNDLIRLILQGGVYSRFHVDPKISDKQYRDLFTLWISNSTKNNTIFVIKRNDRIVAFVSLNEKDKRGNFDFITVDKSFRGRGFGNALLYNAHKWFVSKGYDIAQAVTQRENVVACNVYEKHGYHIEKIENFYHFWMS